MQRGKMNTKRSVKKKGRHTHAAKEKAEQKKTSNPSYLTGAKGEPHHGHEKGEKHLFQK